MPNLLPSVLIGILWIATSAISFFPAVYLETDIKWLKLAVLTSVPIMFLVTFPVMAGLLSWFGQKGIVRGSFPRELMHPVYFYRRIYGLLWTQLYYFKPIYTVVLAIPVLKKVVLRLFGYKYSTNFVVYPDTWIRDLPLLEIGAGAYLSNRATLGSNICLQDGSILVDKIRIGEKALIGHLCIVGPGCKIESGAELGVHSALGIRVNLKSGSSVKPECGINHGSVIGENTSVGSRSHIGMRCIVGPNLKIPAGANIPNGSILQFQRDVDDYYHSETKKLKETVATVSELIARYDEHVS